MTSQEIAKLCGVSKTTVSRVINKDPKVKEATRQKVLAAMKEHNYVPIASARRLAGVASRIIGLFIMDINMSDSKTRVSKSTYFSQLTNLIIDKANNRGFQVLVSIITNQDQVEEAKNLFMSQTIFGGIILGAMNESSEVDALIVLDHPLVLVDMASRYEGKGYHTCNINLDDFMGAYRATQHLIRLGHKKIGHITGDLRKHSAIQRLKGYKQALVDAGIDYDDALVRQGDFQEASGYNLVKELIGDKMISGIFVANDGMAIGALKGAREHGFHVPKDLSIIGFDNIDTGNYTLPTLSSVDGQYDEIAKRCVAALEHFIVQERFANHEEILETDLILRESTKPWLKEFGS